nr:MAG TPA: hypothetical protein [Caudoviricetes sp.]
MTDQQLYIDGVLMDLPESTDVVLDIKSNLFRDVTKMTSNYTYTIQLPRTVHNLSVLQQADRPKSGSRYPFIFHQCSYFRGGVQIIKDGRLNVLSIEESIEVSIYWGIMPAFTKLLESGMKLNELGVTDRVLFEKYNRPNTREEAVNKGIFFAYYNPYRIESKDNFGINLVQRNKYTTTQYSPSRGRIRTGTEVGKYISGKIENASDTICALIPFLPSSTAKVQAQGKGDYRSYAVLDKYMRVISVSGEDETLEVYTIRGEARAAYLVVNAPAEYYSTLSLSVTGLTPMHEMIDGDNKEDFVGDDVAVDEYKTSPKFLQPCVTVNWLLSRIARKSGVSFVWQDDEAKKMLNNLVVPIINNKADDKTIIGNLTADVKSRDGLGALSFSVNNSLTSVTPSTGSDVQKLTITKDCELNFDVQAQYYVRHQFDDAAEIQMPMGVKMTVTTPSTTGGEASTQEYEFGDMEYEDGQDKYPVVLRSDEINGYLYLLSAGTNTISLKKGDVLTFETIMHGIHTVNLPSVYGGKITASVKSGDSVPIGGSFPIGINLPEIEVTNFIKFLALVTGSFPRQLTNSTQVQFIMFSSVWRNKANAYDWSGKLIPYDRQGAPRKSEYSVSDFMQHNRYKWKEDEETHGDYDADLAISNPTLNYEQDTWTLPFAATDGNRIPIRTLDSFGMKNGGEYKGCKERIMTLRDDKEQAALRFGIDLQNIFDTKYKQLAASIAKAHVITERLNLSDLDILDFDETKPVYLAQYGAYFAVLEIKTTNSGYCEVTMIELNN